MRRLILAEGPNTVQGNLDITAQTVDQQGSLEVQGTTAITADTITLDNAQNSFAQAVVIESAASTRLYSQGNLTLEVEVMEDLEIETADLDLTGVIENNLQVTVSNLSQSGSLSVQGASILTAESIDLTEQGNRFVGVINIDTEDASQIVAEGQITLEAESKGNLAVEADRVQFKSALVSGDLELVAKDRVDQVGALSVSGESRMDAGSIDLTNDENAFGKPLTVTVAGEASISASGVLDIKGETGGPTRLTSQDLIFGGVKIGADLQSEATGSISQNGALLVVGGSRFETAALNLQDEGNSFDGAFDANVAGAASVAASGALDVNIVAGEDISLKADDLSVRGLSSLGNVRMEASGGITQTGAIEVSGDTSLKTNSLILLDESNRFGGKVNVTISEQADLSTSHSLTVGGSVMGDLALKAEEVNFTGLSVGQNLDVSSVIGVSQVEALQVRGRSNIAAQQVVLRDGSNSFAGQVTVKASDEASIASTGNLVLGGSIGSDLRLTADFVSLDDLSVGGNTDIVSSKGGVSQVGQTLDVGGKLTLESKGDVELSSQSNTLGGSLDIEGQAVNIAAQSHLTIDALKAQNGRISAGQNIYIQGNVELYGQGVMVFEAKGNAEPVSIKDFAALLPAGLDVYSKVDAKDPVGLVNQLMFSKEIISQTGGVIKIGRDNHLHLSSTEGGSMLLTEANRFEGTISALSGSAGADFNANPEVGQSVVAIRGETGVKIGQEGIEADVVSISSPSLSTEGAAVIRARLPYDDLVQGERGSIPGLVIKVENGREITTPPVDRFKTVRIEVGKGGGSGYVTVLPSDRSSVDDGLVIFLQGPESGNNYLFFYDGAGDPLRVPVSYNGVIPGSPSQNGAITSLFNSVNETQQEESLSATRSEDIKRRVKQGVLLEVGPGQPATQGSGGVRMPAILE